MVIGGVQKNSFIDFPGKISAVLFLAGCNFRCPYCHNPELINVQSECPVFANERWVLEFLKKRRGLLDGVVISGGEPTIHPDLLDLCNSLKKMGYPVKVDTNGSCPQVIQRLISKELVDYIAMDIKTDPAHYPSLTTGGFDPDTILKSIRIIMNSGIDYEFRTTCIRPLVSENIVENIAHRIEGSKLYALQRFRGEKVLRPDVFSSQSTPPGMSASELASLQSIAEPWVQTCIVR